MPVTINGSGTIGGVGTVSTPSGTSMQVPAVNGVAQVSQNSVLSTIASGTVIEFLSIPSHVTEVEIYFNSLSTNSTNNQTLTLGSGAYVTSGYAGRSISDGGSTATFSTSFVYGVGVASARTIFGKIQLRKMTGNVWSFDVQYHATDTGQVVTGNGFVTLTGALDRFKMEAGGSTFDDGEVYVRYA